VIYLRARGENRLDQIEIGIAAAWKGAYAQRVDKFPDLEQLMLKRGADSKVGRDVTEEVLAARRRARAGKGA
jgi:hypothetical protein